MLFCALLQVVTDHDPTIIIWCNMTTMGVVPGHKLEFTLNMMTQLLQQYANKAIGVIIMPNRSSCRDLKGSRKRRQSTPSSAPSIHTKEEEESSDDAERSGSESGDDEEDVHGDPGGELQQIHHDIMVHLMQRDRKLRVRAFNILYDINSVYGQRAATGPGVLVTAMTAPSSWLQVPLWRLQVTAPTIMMSRDQMLKPLRKQKTSALAMGLHFTDAQEKKQHHSGKQVVESIMTGLFKDAKPKLTIIDLHGYDGSTADYTIMRNIMMNGGNCCVTVAHELEVSQVVADKVGQLVFDSCKSRALIMSGFPEFDPIVRELQDHHARAAQLDTASYKVTMVLPNGVLAILETYIAQWKDHESWGAPFKELLDQHNKEFNPEGVLAGSHHQEVNQKEEDEPQAKRARTMTTTDHEEVEQDVKTEEELLRQHPTLCMAQLSSPAKPHSLTASQRF